MKNDVFISYSSKDRPFAQKLAKALEQQGISVWIDREDIRAGIKWSSAIQEGLDQSSVIVIIISHDSMRSKNVEDEWQYFLDKRKPIVPILHVPTDNIHFQLMRIQYIDFVNNPFDDAVQLLLYELRQYNIGTAATETPIPNQAKLIPTPTNPPTSSRKLIFGFLGAGLVVVIALLAIVMRPSLTPIVTQTNTVVTEEATSNTTPTEVAFVAATKTPIPPTKFTGETSQRRLILKQ